VEVQLSNDTEDEDDEAVLQEREVMASPDIELVREPTEALEDEVEDEEEDRESDRIEEREDEIVSEGTKPSRRVHSIKSTRHASLAHKRTRMAKSRRGS
jgi:hypothetical protein